MTLTSFCLPSGLQMEYDRLKMEKLSAARHQANWANVAGPIEEEFHNNITAIQRREDALAEANAMQHVRDQLERRMEILEEHNQLLIDQLSRMRMLLGAEQPMNGTAGLHAEKAATTSILKNSSNQIPPRRDQHKSIHFSNNNMVVNEDFSSIR